MTLRRYQSNAVDDAKAALMEYQRIVLTLPTGAGKTLIAGEIARRHLTSNSRRHVWFLVDRINLVDQTENKFDGLRCQVLQGKNTKYDGLADVTIATVQTLESRLDHGMVSDPTLIFIDECHIQRELYADLPQRHSSALIIGMTATPLHPSMGMVYETVVQGPSIGELINEGWLVQPRYYVPAEPDLTGITKVKGEFGTPDFVQSQLGKRMSTIVGDVLQSWRDLAEHRKTIVFACDIAHADLLTAEFNSHGVRSGVIHSKSDSNDVVLQGFKAGTVQVLINVNVLTAGFDQPDIECVVLARPTLSKTLHIQQIGRGLRISNETGKQDVMVIDHAGNIHRHGRAEDFAPPESLDEKELTKRAKSADVSGKKDKPCKVCGFLIQHGTYECPECGYSWSPPPQVTMVDGAIVELDTGRTVIGQVTPERFYQEALGFWETDKSCIKENARPRNPNQTFNYFRRRAFKSTKTFCRLKGYQMPPPWKLNKLDSVEPSHVVKGELKRQQIAYFKQRKTA